MIIAHTADWEIGPSGERLDPESGLNARMIDRFHCAEFVIQDAIERGAQIILHAGDLWRGSGESAYGCRPTPTQVWLAREALRPAIAAGVPVVIIQGNHDMARSSAEKGALDLIRDMEGVTIVERPCLLNVWHTEEIDGVLVRGPYRIVDPEHEAVYGGDFALQVACLPYPNRAQLLTDEEARKLAPGDLNLLIRERMMDIARDLASKRVPGMPCVLLGHFAVDTAAAGAQNTLGMIMGEFSLSIYELLTLGFDAVMLGHYHKPQNLAEPVAYVTYSGSPEGITFAEEGEAKRYVLWHFGEEPHPFHESIPTPYRRLVTITADEMGVPFVGDDVKGAIVRLKIPQALANRTAEFRHELELNHAHEVRVEIEHAETVRRREIGISGESDMVESMDAWLQTKPDLKPMRDELQAMAAYVEHVQ